MSNPTSNFGWQMPTPTDLVTDLPADFEVFGQAVDTSLADLRGGTTGQILSKTTNADMDFTWTSANPGDITGVTAGTGISGGGTSGDVTITNDMATTITAAGDIVVGTGSGTYDNLPIGTTNQVLTADTSVSPYKVKWATPAGGGALTYITQTDFTTQTSQAFDNVFTSTYDTYFVILENITGSVATADLQLQLRYGGTTATADYYQVIYGSSYNVSVMTVSNASTVSQITLATSVGNLAPSGQLAQFYFRRVGISGKPIFMGQLASNYNLESKTITGFQDTTQTYDGFLLKPDSGNISGNVKIYGIKDS